jgi:large-conductance mechanosensitive channel
MLKNKLIKSIINVIILLFIVFIILLFIVPWKDINEEIIKEARENYENINK